MGQINIRVQNLSTSKNYIDVFDCNANMLISRDLYASWEIKGFSVEEGSGYGHIKTKYSENSEDGWVSHDFLRDGDLVKV